VAYGNNPPDEATRNVVLRELQDNNIDATQLVDWPANHCQEPESSAEGGSNAVGIEILLSAISDNLDN
jgi:hypothetical protein